MKSPLFRGVIFGIMLLALAAGIFSTRQAHAASGANCDNNAVVFCGASSVNGLIAKYNNGDAHNSAASIHHIYSGFGITASDIQAMGTTAQSGTVTSSGNVFVGNQLVATSALTAGRQDIEPGSSRQANQGTVFFTRAPSVSFLSGQLPAFVVMKNGVFQFAILTSCGNPVTAHPKTTPPPPAPKQPTAPTPQPKPAKPTPVHTTVNNVCSGNTSNSNSGTAAQGGNCSTNTTVVQTQAPATQATPSQTPTGQCISMSAAVNQDDTLTATAMVNFQTQGGAQLQSITYDFGDGATVPPTTQTSMTHTYQQAGTYTVTATLAFTGGSSAITPATCQATVTASAPPTTPPATVTSDVTSTPASPAPAAQTPSTQLVNTGPGDILGIFGVISAIGAIGYRVILVRYLSGRPY